MSNEDTIQKLVSGFTSGVSEGLPDIVLVEDYAAQNFLINYEGKFAELSDEIDFSQFAPYKVEAGTKGLSKKYTPKTMNYFVQ